MPQYLLQSGNTPSLTLFEARSVTGTSVEELTPEAVRFSAPDDEEAQRLFSLLGGSVRLARIEQDWQEYSAETLEKALLELLLIGKPSKLRFSVAQWGNQQSQRLSLFTLKEKLEEAGVKTRFLEGARDGLSAAVLLHQNVVELIVVEKEGQLLLARTVAVQDIDHWTVKDRRKPYSDRKKGMLPPKLARALVNIALGAEVSPDTLLYDPFCGTGTVLIEALERGARVVGSDADSVAVEGTQMNLAWFTDAFHLTAPFSVFPSDVSQVSLNQLPGKVDVIVTEPFLGKVQPKPHQLEGMFRGLEKLYLGAFRQWRGILQTGARVVMIFPRVEAENGRVYDFSRFVDKLQADGYTLQVDFGTLRYHRRDAVVQRDIGIFEYNPI